MAIGPSQDTASVPDKREAVPLQPGIVPARGVLLAVSGGVLVWVALAVAYVLTR